MKQKLFTLAALGTMLLAAACTEKMAVPDDPVTPEGTPFSVKKGIGAYCLPLPSEAADTKSSFVYGDVEKKKMIRSVQVFVYEDVDGGDFVDAAYFVAERPLSRFDLIDIEGMLVDEGGNLEPRKTYRFYFLANLPEIAHGDIPGSEEEIEDWTCSLDNYDTFNTYGFPMCAQFTDGFAVEDFSGAWDIPFTRLVSQWKVTLKDTGSGVTFDNCSVAVRNAARTIQPFSSHPAPAQVFNDNILASGDHGNMSIAASGDVAYFYVLENMGGEAFPDAESLYDRDVKDVNKNNPNIHPTYIEITSKGTIDGTALILDNTVYRYALGNGNVTNADAQRHTEYNVSLNFTETAAENEGWVKEIGDPYVENPHVGFVHRGTIVNYLGSNFTIQYDQETKDLIHLGESISLEWTGGIFPYIEGTGQSRLPLLTFTSSTVGISMSIPSSTRQYLRSVYGDKSYYVNGPTTNSTNCNIEIPEDVLNTVYEIEATVTNGKSGKTAVAKMPIKIGPIRYIIGYPAVGSYEPYNYTPNPNSVGYYSLIVYSPENIQLSIFSSNYSSYILGFVYTFDNELLPQSITSTGVSIYYMKKSQKSKWYSGGIRQSLGCINEASPLHYAISGDTPIFYGALYSSLGFNIGYRTLLLSPTQSSSIGSDVPYAIKYSFNFGPLSSKYFLTGGPGFAVRDCIGNASITPGNTSVSYSYVNNLSGMIGCGLCVQKQFVPTMISITDLGTNVALF